MAVNDEPGTPVGNDGIQVFPPKELPKTYRPQIAGVMLIISMLLFMFWAWNLYYSAEQTKDLSGSGIAGGIIYERLGNEDIPLRDVVVIVEDTNLTATTDTAGQYEIANIPAGIHRLRYEKPGYKIIVLKVIIYSTKDLDRNKLDSNNFTFPMVSRGGLQLLSFSRHIDEISYPLSNGTLMVSVSNETGSGLAGVELNYTSLDYELPGTGLGDDLVLTDGNGEIQLNLTPGMYRLNMSKTGYSTVLAEVLVSPGNHTDLLLSMLPGSGVTEKLLSKTVRLTGQVKTPNDESIRDVLVAIEGTNISTLTDVSGEYVLEDVPPGLRTLIMTRVGYSALSAELFIETNRSFDHELESLGKKTYDNSDVTLTRLYQCSLIYVVVGIFLLAGGVFALKRKSYGMALFAALMGLGATVQFINWYHICAAAILCAIALVLVFISRREFN